MANADFSKLSTRARSALVTAIHNEITYYSNTFCIRPRAYINRLTKKNDNIYWLDDESKNLAAFAILDSNHTYQVDGISLQTLGHTISKRQGYMQRILSHIFKAKKNQSIALLCKDFVARSLAVIGGKTVEISPNDLSKIWPALAQTKTNYFNVEDEPLINGMIRKQHNLYLSLTEDDKQKLSQLGINLDTNLDLK